MLLPPAVHRRGSSRGPVTPEDDEPVGRVRRVHSTVQFHADSQIRHLGERYRLSVASFHRSQIRQLKVHYQRIVGVVGLAEEVRSLGYNAPTAHRLSGGGKRLE